MLYISNAFSLQMLKDLIRRDWDVSIYIREIGVDEVRVLLSTYFTSAIGHQGTAEFLTRLLGIEVPTNRQAITLKPGDKVIVVQPWGERLPPGQELTAEVMKKLYDEGRVKFILIQVP